MFVFLLHSYIIEVPILLVNVHIIMHFLCLFDVPKTYIYIPIGIIILKTCICVPLFLLTYILLVCTLNRECFIPYKNNLLFYYHILYSLLQNGTTINMNGNILINKFLLHKTSDFLTFFLFLVLNEFLVNMTFIKIFPHYIEI